MKEDYENIMNSLNPMINQEYEKIIALIKESIKEENIRNATEIDEFLTPKMTLAGVMNEQLQDYFTRRNV